MTPKLEKYDLCIIHPLDPGSEVDVALYFKDLDGFFDVIDLTHNLWPTETRILPINCRVKAEMA